MYPHAAARWVPWLWLYTPQDISGSAGIERSFETFARFRTDPKPALFSKRSVGEHFEPLKTTLFARPYTHTLLWSSFKCGAGISASSNADASPLFLLEGCRTSGCSSTPLMFYLSSCWRRSCREWISVINTRWKL